MSDIEIIKRLYNDYVNRYLKKIFLALFFSTNIFLTAGSSNQAIEAVLPAIIIEKNNAKKIFLIYLLT